MYKHKSTRLYVGMYCVENNACMFHGHASVVSLTLFKEKDRGGGGGYGIQCVMKNGKNGIMVCVH
jgi:hypothetical protein